MLPVDLALSLRLIQGEKQNGQEREGSELGDTGT